MRKSPKQQRSQKMVDALIEATGRAIAEQGLVHASTNHIAAQAGVSVGSLYQYFDSKGALVEALLDRLSRDLAGLIDQRIDGLLDADVRTTVHGLLSAVFAFMQKDEGLYLELARNWHQLHSMRVVDQLERHMFEVCRLYLLRHLNQFRISNPHAVLFVIINSTLMTLIRYLSQPHAHLRKDEIIDCLSDMLAAYMRSLNPAPEPAPPTA